MGRITVFITDANTACTRVIAAFRALKIPIAIINLSRYPDKRDDMVSLCMLNSTPQVFFNTRHIGSSSATFELLDDWSATCAPDLLSGSTHGGSSVSSYSSGGGGGERGSNASKQTTDSKRSNRSSTRSTHTYASIFDRYVAEIGNYHDPTDRRLSLPDTPSILDEPGLPRDPNAEFCITIPGDTSTVLEMTQMLIDLIPHEDHTVGSVTFRHSFEGSKVIQILQATFEIPGKEAFRLAFQLLSVGVFLSLDGSPGIAFDVESLYRLQCYHTPGILNSYRVWTESTDANGLRLVHHLMDKLNAIEIAATNKRGYFNINRARRMPEYSEFEEAICELQGVVLSKMNHTTKMAFAINVFNLMIKYATLKLGIVPVKNPVARAAFFSSIKFNIGGHLYSFHDWEHGILRGNVKAPNRMAAPFDRDDPRQNFVVSKSDPRVHFCLSTNHGSGSCPAFGKFSADNLDEELTIAAACFCEDDCNLRIETQKREIHVSKIFLTYKNDFVKDTKSLPHLLSKYMNGRKKQVLDTMIEEGKAIKIVEIPLEWTVSHCTGGPNFDPEMLKMEHQKGGLSNLLHGSPRKSPTKKNSTIML